MVVWVIIRFSLVCLFSLIQVSFFSFKLALDRMENFKNPRSGPPGPPQEEDRETQGSKKRFGSGSGRTSTEPPGVKTPNGKVGVWFSKLPIKDRVLSPFFLLGFRVFSEASLGPEELQRFFSLRSCGSISEHSRSGIYQPWPEWECWNSGWLKLRRVWPVRSCTST